MIDSPLTLFSDVVHLNTDRIKDPLAEGIEYQYTW